MTEEEFLLQFTTKGAEEAEGKTKKVSKSLEDLNVTYEKVSKTMKSPLGGEMDASAFTAKARGMEDSLEHLGVTYDKVKGKMSQPLGLGDSMLTGKNFAEGARGLDAFGKGAEDAGNKANSFSQSVNAAGRNLYFFQRVIATLGVVKLGEELFDLANNYRNLENKVAAVTDSHEQASLVMDKLLGIADRSRSSMDAVGTMYQRVTRATATMGVSQNEVFHFTENLSKAITASGASALEAKYGMIQLSQAMSLGKLSGQDLHSVMSELPTVAQIIADKMGVQKGQLRKLGEEGKITAKIMFDAVSEATTRINADFDKMAVTVPQAWTSLMNHIEASTTQLDGPMGDLAKLLLYVRDNLDTVERAAESLGSMLAVGLAGYGISAVIDGLIALSAYMLANPFTALLEIIALCTAGIVPFADKIVDTTGKLFTLRDVGAATFYELRDAMGEFKDEGVTKTNSSLDYMLTTLAKIMDLINNFTMTGFAENIAHLIRGEYDQIHPMEMAVKNIEESARKIHEFNADADAGDAFIKQENDDIQEYLNTFRNKKAADIPGKQKKERGLSFEAEMTALKSKQEREELPEDEEALAKEQLAAYKKLKDSVYRSLTDAQADALELQVRVNFEFEQDDKLQKRLDKELEKMQAEEEAYQLREAEKMEKAYTAEMHKIFTTDQALIKSFETPREKYNTELSDAQDFLTRHPEQFQNVQKHLARERDKLLNHHELDTPVDAYNQKAKDLQEDVNNNPALFGKAQESLGKMTSEYQAFMPIFSGISDSIAEAAANSIVFGDNMSNALKKIAQSLSSQLISTLFKMGFSAASSALTGSGSFVSGASAGVTPSLPASSSLQLTPLQTPSVFGSYPTPHYASGGYTGDYPTNQLVGMVHGQEMVMNAQTTAKYRPMFEAMNAGHMPSGGGGGNTKVTVHNYAGADVQVTPGPSHGEVNVMIKRGVEKHAPAVVAGSLRDTNSAMSKAMQRHVDAQRRR